MSVRERILAILLTEKIIKNPAYAKQIGLSAENRKRSLSNNRTKKRCKF